MSCSGEAQSRVPTACVAVRWLPVITCSTEHRVIDPDCTQLVWRSVSRLLQHMNTERTRASPTSAPSTS